LSPTEWRKVCGSRNRRRGDKDIRIGGGIATVRQYLRAGLVDSLHFALAPVVRGQGKALFTDLDLGAPGFSVKEHQATHYATHFVRGRAWPFLS
jgi:dihydrofolate reductase